MDNQETQALTTRPMNGMQRNEIPEGAALVRREFGSQEIVARGETATSAVAAQAEAQVKARFAMALHRPRSMGDARLRVIQSCKRPRFAQVARYRKPQGRKKNEETGQWEEAFIVGWSIRAAEEFARSFGNIDVQESVIYDDSKQRILRVTAVDLESNYATTKEVVVAKVIERSKLRDGQTALGTRTNSYGKPVFLVEPTDDELLTKQNALLSKARRNAILALIPGDILDEAQDEVTEAATAGDKKDPGTAMRKLQDAFVTIGVKPSQLEQYLGHGLDVIGAKEIETLRQIFTSIRDGEAKWADFVDAAGDDPQKQAAASSEPAKTDAPPKTPGDLKAREKAKKTQAAAPAPAPSSG